MRELYKKLGINGSFTTAYHPQSNGQTERANQEVEKYLRLFVSRRQNDWSELLPTAEFVINSHVSSATGTTPFEVMYGYRPDFTIPIGKYSHVPRVEERLKKLEEARKEAEAALRMSKERMVDKTKNAKPSSFQEGDKVWLQAKNIKVHQASEKLGPRKLGPYTVVKVLDNDTYKLDLPPALKVHDVFHAQRLWRYGGNDINGKLPPPPEPVLIDGEEEYEVDEILDSRVFRRQLQYLVHWKGYSQGSDSWEPAKNVANASELIQEFHQKHPQAPKRLSAAFFLSLPWQTRPQYTTTPENTPSWELGRSSGR